MRLSIDIAQRRSRLYAYRPQLWVDKYAFHYRKINDDAIIAQGSASHIVAAAFDRDEQVVFMSKLHGMNDIRHPRTAGNQTRMLIDARIPDPARRIVAGIARLDDSPVEIILERLYERGVDGDTIATLEHRYIHVPAPPLEVTRGANLSEVDTEVRRDGMAVTSQHSLRIEIDVGI
jgi:hypothetical protein